VCSLVSSGNSEEQVGAPETHRFLRMPSFSLKRLPDRATSVRLMTSTLPLWGFFVCSSTPSPTRNPPGFSNVISWSYQSESAASLIVSEAILVMMLSGPLPSSRMFDGRNTALRSV